MTRSLEALCEAAEIQAGNPAEGAAANADTNTNTDPALNGNHGDENQVIPTATVKTEEQNVTFEEQQIIDAIETTTASLPLLAPANPIAPSVELIAPTDPIVAPLDTSITVAPVAVDPFTDAPATVAPDAPEQIAPTNIVASTNPVAENPVNAANPITADPITANPVAANPVTANPVAADPVAADPVTANPVAANPVPAPITTEQAAPVPNHDFQMDVKIDALNETVPSLPALVVPTATDPPGIKVHDVSEVVERAQQEAIAAVVAAQGPPPLPSPVPPQPVKPARKRGWVKKTWEERLEELKAYKALNGDCNVPTICKSNPSLGHWVHDQRKQYRLYQNNKQTSMNPLRIAQLEEVGFKWALQRHTTMRSWAERFGQLEDFKKANGHCNVPIRYKVNPSLGQWVSTQRQEYSNYQHGKKSNMTTDRITKLEAAEFCWSLRDTAKMAPRKSWDMHFAALKEFKKDNGHCDVRVRSKQNPTGSLGRWVEKQRSQYHSRNEGKESKLTQEQVDKLDSIGFKWRIRHERNKISGCARNPQDPIDNEALLDEYTKRSLDETAKINALAQAQAQAQAHAQAQIQAEAHAQAEAQAQAHAQAEAQAQAHAQAEAQAHAQLQAQQMGEQAQQMVAQQMAVHMNPEPMKIDDEMEGVITAAAVEPVSMEAAAAAAVEAIPVETHPQPDTIPVHVPVYAPVPAPMPVPAPLHIPESFDAQMTHEV